MVLSKSSYECSLAGETHPRHLVIAECSGGCPPGKQRESEHVHCRVTIEFRLSVLANILATVGEPLFATTLQPPANYPATTVQLTPLAGPSFSEPSHTHTRPSHSRSCPSLSLHTLAQRSHSAPRLHLRWLRLIQPLPGAHESEKRRSTAAVTLVVPLSR